MLYEKPASGWFRMLAFFKGFPFYLANFFCEAQSIKNRKGRIFMSTITAEVNNVFLHVENLLRAAEWYHHLLNIPYDATRVVSPVYNIPIQGNVGLTLDDHTMDPTYIHAPSPNAVFNFFAADIDLAFSHVQSLNIPIVKDIERIDDFAYFTCRDVDGNVIMICNG